VWKRILVCDADIFSDLRPQSVNGGSLALCKCVGEEFATPSNINGLRRAKSA